MSNNKHEYKRSMKRNLTQWAEKAMNDVQDEEAKMILTSILKDPFQNFSERYFGLGMIMQREGGVSPAVLRTIFMGSALGRYKIITMRELSSTYEVMDKCFEPCYDTDLESRFRLHALEILLKVWDRADEIGTLVHQEQKRVLGK